MLPGHVVRGRKNPLHWKFPERLRKARKSRDLTAAALSLAAGIGRGSVALMESGERLPRTSTVERLAAVLKVSPAWLAFGLDDGDVPDPGVGQRWKAIAARTKDTRDTRGLSLSEVGRRANSSAAAVRALEAGSDPTLDTVEALAMALAVSPTWLAFGMGLKEIQRRTARPAQQQENRAT